jgi:glutamate-1-semialdehyde aminotransferase
MPSSAALHHLDKSRALYRRACEIILGGSQTISKQPGRYDPDRFPAYIERGAGCRLWDIDGNEYLDYVMALGPVVLGYCHPAVDEAVRAQLSRGVLFSSNSPLEVELAEKLIARIPNAERVRFFKSGAEATSAAVRLARNFTGRSKVVSVGYSGWHDWWTAKQESGGIPEAVRQLTLDLRYGDSEGAVRLMDREGPDIACVVVEPVVSDLDLDFLRIVIDAAHAAGALVVFDEIITGFRVGPGGVQGRFSLNADMATFGKAIANGFPLSVVTGRRDIFEAGKDLWISSTFGGETLSLAAAIATLNELDKPGVVDWLWASGEQLRLGWLHLLQSRAAIHATVKGFGPLPVLQFSKEARRQEDEFMAGMLDRGFLVRRGHYWFVTASHQPADIEMTLSACREVFDEIVRPG